MNLSFCQEQDRGWNYLKHLFDSFAFGKMSLVGIERIKGVTLSKVGESWREREVTKGSTCCCSTCFLFQWKTMIACCAKM